MKKLRQYLRANRLVKTNIIIISVAILFSVFITFLFIRMITIRDMQLTTQVLFKGIYTTMNNEIEFPARVSQTMCYDTLLQELLDQEDTLPEEEFEEKLSNYLRTIRDGHKWESAYLVSAKTLKYYTPDGCVKVVNPEVDEYDLWYTNFLKTGLDYGADMTYDQHNDQTWTIFIDRRFEVNGELKAVLGCGIYLSDITDLLTEYSQQYDVDIYFTDENNNITLDKYGIDVGEAYYSRSYSSNFDTIISNYNDDGTYTVKQYLPLLGMYLVVKNNNSILSKEFTVFIIVYLAYIVIFVSMLATFNVIKEKHEKDDLKHKVRTDYLTKISNLNGLKSNINLFIEEEGSRMIGGSMFMLDVDHFKEVNDTFGHAKGDEVLTQIASLLSKSFRGGDIVGRLGGDEFMVFSPSMKDYVHIVQKCDELIKSLTLNITEGDKTVTVTASIGVSIFPMDADNYHDLYETADKALYYAKKHGRNCYYIYSDLVSTNAI